MGESLPRYPNVGLCGISPTPSDGQIACLDAGKMRRGEAMRIPSSGMIGEVCSECDHSVARHDLTTMPNASAINAKCKICPCDGKLSLA